jgi:hypothetical protein
MLIFILAITENVMLNAVHLWNVLKNWLILPVPGTGNINNWFQLFDILPDSRILSVDRLNNNFIPGI